MQSLTAQIYADFADPWSALASVRADALVAAGASVKWRAVQGRHTVVVKSTLPTAQQQDEIDQARRWHEQHLSRGERPEPLRCKMIPSSSAPIAALAEATASGIGHNIRRVLYSTAWSEGSDIGDPEVLRRLLSWRFRHGNDRSDIRRRSGYAVSMAGGPVTHEGWMLLEEWQQSWLDLGQPQLPALVLSDGELLSGAAAVRRLGEVRESRADTQPVSVDRELFPLPALPAGSCRSGIDQPSATVLPWYRQ